MAEQARILVVEDDPELGSLIGGLLEREGFAATAVPDGKAMDAALKRAAFDLVILDLMLPGEDGLSICRRLRARSTLPILILTAKKEDIDRIIGLELGADDYLGKPFNPRELTARIRAILRRATPTPDTPREVLEFGRWRLDTAARALWLDGQEHLLTSGEYDLLVTFVTHPNRVLSRDWLLEATQDRSAEPFDRSIDVQVSRLRRKLRDDPRAPRLIKTVRNGGYIFTAEVSSP
ncbi:MAG: response regulator [Pseudomonadota bacterium]